MLEAVSLTPDMERHLTFVESKLESSYSQYLKEAVERFIDDPDESDFDDSEIYEEVKKNEKEYDYSETKETPEEKKYIEKICMKLKGKINGKDKFFEF